MLMHALWISPADSAERWPLLIIGSPCMPETESPLCYVIPMLNISFLLLLFIFDVLSFHLYLTWLPMWR